MTSRRSDLLEPSLSSETGRQAPFSPNSVFYLGFLGATLGVALFAGVNARRMGRLGQQWPIYFVGVVLGLLATGLLVAIPRGVETRELFGMHFNNDAVAKIAPRIIGLVYAGIVFAINRPLYSARRLTGSDYASPWAPGILCFLIDLAATLGVVYLVGVRA
jgi:hypothetical protein